MTQPSLLIVGGTHGIGLEIARRYAGEGWSVVLAGRDGAHAKSVAAELGGETRGIALDLSEPEQVADALADIGAVDHIVLSAIDRDTNMIDDYDIAAARYLAIMKIVGYTAVVSALRERLAEDGSVVLFGGRAKDRPYPGLDDGHHSQRRHLRHGAHAGSAARTSPGERDPSGHRGRQSLLVGEAWRSLQRSREATPTGRSVTMADIVDGVDFLMRNRSVNGIDLYVDGGWLLHMRVALIGAGRMGSAMAGRIAAAGHDVVVFNRTGPRAAEVAGRTGGRVADTAREAAESAEVCLVSLADDAAVMATYLDDNGLIAGLQPGAVVCDASTVAPATVRGLAPLVAQQGATLARHSGIGKRLGRRVRDSDRDGRRRSDPPSIMPGRCWGRSRSRSSISATSGRARP